MTQTPATQTAPTIPPTGDGAVPIIHAPVALTPEDLLQTEAGKALAERVRKEEKDKLYEGKKKSDKTTRALEEEKAQLLVQQAALQKKIDEAEAEKESSSKDLKAQLAEVREKQRLSEAKSEAILDTAAKMVKESEINSLKKEKLAQAGVDRDLVDLSNASTPEAIDEAIAAAKVKEQSIEERIRAKVREEMGQQVPKPLAPQQESRGPMEMAGTDPARRLELARKSPEEYAKIREALLKKAEASLQGG